ncbi:MAG TPA: ATP-dependent DNA helicase RecG [Burkholderiales bacterium]
MKAEGIARKFEKLGLRSRFDYVLHLPLRYEDETVLYEPASAPMGRSVTVETLVRDMKVEFPGRRQLVVRAEGLVLRYYSFWPSLQKQFREAIEQGLKVRAHGELRWGRLGPEMIHPRCRLVRGDEPLPTTLTPIYPTTAGLSQDRLRKAVLEALDTENLDDLVAAKVRRRYGLAEFADSVRLLHRPPPGADLASLSDRTHGAWQRIKLDELLAQQLSMEFANQYRRSMRAPSIPGNGPLLRAFMKKLPFRLTRDQTRVLNEVLHDMREPYPMQRLLQGDVGSGKTIVAGIACLAAVDAGWQAAVMAPTEILGEQHFRKFNEWFAPLGVSIGWLHGGLPKKERRPVLDAQIIIGTHALIQESAAFDRLGLAIVDEQHRFGAKQRMTLRRKAAEVFAHQLIMSATPIPRTLAMTHYADRDVSVIEEMPPGRQPVTTRLFTDEKRPEVLKRVREACAEGQQAYWVCPVIEESKEGDVKTALDTYARLRTELKGLRIGLLHGRLDTQEKADAMRAFESGRTQLLVCTTVVEVGVDVPKASLMVIESAERFGLAQLHQLRGRIGRGARESVCVLLYAAAATENAALRLTTMKEQADGFAIAELDLKMRGEGDYLGEKQSGRLLRFADLRQDRDLVELARKMAPEMIASDSQAARALVARWLGSRRELTHA